MLVKEVIYDEDDTPGGNKGKGRNGKDMSGCNGGIKIRLWNLPPIGEIMDESTSFVECTTKLPGGNPLRTSKTGVSTENPQKLQSEKPREYPSSVKNVVEFNGLRDSDPEPHSMAIARCGRQLAQPDAPGPDVSALGRAVEGESAAAANTQPTRRPRSRIKPPIIEVVYVPTKFDPDDAKVVYDILADWILKDIEKEIKKKTSSE